MILFFFCPSLFFVLERLKTSVCVRILLCNRFIALKMVFFFCRRSRLAGFRNRLSGQRDNNKSDTRATSVCIYVHSANGNISIEKSNEIIRFVRNTGQMLRTSYSSRGTERRARSVDRSTVGQPLRVTKSVGFLNTRRTAHERPLSAAERNVFFRRREREYFGTRENERPNRNRRERRPFGERGNGQKPLYGALSYSSRDIRNNRTSNRRTRPGRSRYDINGHRDEIGRFAKAIFSTS